MQHSAANVDQIKQHSYGQQAKGRDLSHPQEHTHRGPAINTQAAHAHGDGRASDDETPGRILMTKAGEKAADNQRSQRMGRSQQRRNQRSESQDQDGQRESQFHDPLHTIIYH